MFQRSTRIIGTFFVTLACFVVYANAVVPWIEPSIRINPYGAGGGHPHDVVEAQRKDLRYWFAEEDWEMTNPKILETREGKLLFEDYQTRPDGWVEVTPCSMVFLKSDPALGDEERKRRAFVLRAPQGALLQFDSPMDLAKGQIGNLIGGKLLGEVRIHSGQRLPGPEDDLHIVTRDVDLSQTEITTPHRMDFSLGPHHGRGQGVLITLDSQTENGRLEVSGMRTFTLQDQVFVHLEAAEGSDLFPRGAADAATSGGPARGKRSPPIEIRSAGPFTFDCVANVGTFNKQVDVVRVHLDGVVDRMNGDLMKVHFTAPEEAPQSIAAEGEPSLTTPKKGDPTQQKLDAKRIEVFGEPVVIRADSNGLQARAQYLDYDVPTRGIRLRDVVEVVVRQAGREIHAPELFVEPEAAGNFATVLASGPGRLFSTAPDAADQTITAEWSRRLHFRPHEGQYVLTAEGSARYEAVGKGSLAADEIHLWLNEVVKAGLPPSAPGEKPKTELAPDRLLAVGTVVIESPQLNGAVARLEGWFENNSPGVAEFRRGKPREELGDVVLASAEEPLRFPQAGSQAVADVQQVPLIADRPSAPEPLPAPIADEDRPAKLIRPTAAPLANQPGPAAPPQRRYHIDGELMRMRIGIVDKAMQLREAVVEQNVRLTETQLTNPTDKPLVLTGERLHLVQPTPEHSHVTATGTPVFVEGRDMTISGGKLTLDRPDADTNHLAVEGQGVLTLPVDKDLQGKPTAGQQRLHLTWQGGMTFDGAAALFERGVEGRLPDQYLRTDRLQVFFSRPPQMQGSDDGAQPEITHVECRDGVFLESRTPRTDGAPASIERLTARTLDFDQTTGDVAADGPGEVVSVRRGAPPNPGAPQGANPQAGPGGIPLQPVGFLPGQNGEQPDEETLNRLHVRFQRNMAGNQRRGDMTFFNQVRTLYGPVPDWEATIDEDHPQHWTPKTVLINCDRMQVTQAADAAGGNVYDLVADGNALVEGSAFTARSPRLTYSQVKDLLVIEGDARTDAVLYQAKKNGQSSAGTTAKKFMIWPQTNRVQVDGVTFLELTPN